MDPIQDRSNWYVYCGNNPLNRVDPTGLRDVGEDAFEVTTSPASDFTKVELIYKQIGDVFGKPHYHAYVKVTGPDGDDFFIRGGSGDSPNSGVMSVASSDASGTGSSGDGEFGNIY